MLFCRNNTVLAVTLFAVLAAPWADAARMGKGRSAGMQRAMPARTYQAPPSARLAAPPPPSVPTQAPATRGPGIGTAIAAGAAGTAAGYMLGSVMNNHNGPATPQAAATPANPDATADQGTASLAQHASSGMPWGMLILLGLLLCGGFMLFRRKVSTLTAPAPMYNRRDRFTREDAQFRAIPKIGSGTGDITDSSQTSTLTCLPDGTETPHFLRQAKATFLHLQSLNTPESLEEVRCYMTNDLFNALSADIAQNTEIADFQQLDCQLAEAKEENTQYYIATVRFSGMVSEAVGAPVEPFTEYWHYTKEGNGRWLVAGIQQG